MVAKAGLGLIGLGAISVGGVALANPAWLGMSDPMPTWHSLSEDSEFSGDSPAYSNGNFGKKYGKYLVGVSKVENKEWWEWAYRRLSRSNDKDKSGKFKSVTPGYETNAGNTNTLLHKVCEEAYKQNTTALKGDDASVNTSEFKKSEVWKYCSPGSLNHTNADNPLYPNGKIGGETNNTSKLISVKDSSNDWFWEKRNEDFWSTDTNNDWSGSKATEADNNKSIFKTEYETNKEDGNKDKRKTIKDLCGQAYDENKDSKGNKNNDDAKRFCVLETSGS